MKTPNDFLDYTFRVHPNALCRMMQVPVVELTMFDGDVKKFNFDGLLQMTNDQLDERYTKVFGRRAWHLTREGYIYNLAAEQANK